MDRYLLDWIKFWGVVLALFTLALLLGGSH